MLETGPISRFDKVGNFVSYCRKVSSKWVSNDKAKGKGNKKSGNKYLPGPSPRQPSSRGDCTTNPERITIGRCRERTS